MFSASSTIRESVPQTISELIEVSKFDTLYRDLYLQRARELMSTTLSEAAYTNIKQGTAELGLLEHQLRASIEQGNWKRACEFTDRVSQIRKTAAAKSASIGLADVVYDKSTNVPMDPFSPGFHVFLNASTETLREWGGHALEILSRLGRTLLATISLRLPVSSKLTEGHFSSPDSAFSHRRPSCRNTNKAVVLLGQNPRFLGYEANSQKCILQATV
jgi:hypothetical protein